MRQIVGVSLLFLLLTGFGIAQDDNPPNPGSVKTNSKDDQRYVWIPAGSFVMGCSLGDSECQDREKPAHKVSITKGFWLGQTSVKVGAWKKYVAAMGLQMPPEPKPLDKEDLNPGWRDDQQPIVDVTWDEAKGFCEWIGGRLPTEAEWEYAARAGNTRSRDANLDDIAWYGDNSGNQHIDSTALYQPDSKTYLDQLLASGDRIHPVGQKLPNAWKLYDMLGNVWQWTADWYGEKYYDQQEATDPQGPLGGQYRSLRGGSWYAVPRFVRVSVRFWLGPGIRLNYNGLRCVGE